MLDSYPVVTEPVLQVMGMHMAPDW